MPRLAYIAFGYIYVGAVLFFRVSLESWMLAMVFLMEGYATVAALKFLGIEYAAAIIITCGIAIWFFFEQISSGFRGKIFGRNNCIRYYRAFIVLTILLQLCTLAFPEGTSLQHFGMVTIFAVLAQLFTIPCMTFYMVWMVRGHTRW